MDRKNRWRIVALSGLLGAAMAAEATRVRAADAGESKVKGSAVAYRQNRELLIHYKSGQADQARQKADQAGFDVVEDYKPGKFLRCVHRPGVAAVLTSVNTLAASEAIATVEPNYIMSIPRPPAPAELAEVAPRAGRDRWAGREQRTAAVVTPNDSRFSELWGMMNVRAPLAWQKNHDSDVVVAVIDTGIDYNHEDLQGNIWTNPGETGGGKETNGLDDDGNGIKDDVFGAKFSGGVGSGDPKDDNEHGTHCAGTIGAVGNNARGVVGVNWKIKIMALKFLDASGSGATNDAVRCIDYAIDQKSRGVNVKVLSNSWGGGGDSQALRDAITRAEQAGMLFVAAASNEGVDTDVTPNFPSTYPNANILAVAAIDVNEKKPAFSNFGLTTVDLAAPGVAILSSVPNNGYASFSGTSMATPHVAGAAALAWANPGLKSKSAVELKSLIMKNARPIASMAGKCVTGGTLDISFLGTDSDSSPTEGLPQDVAYIGGQPGQSGTFVLAGSTGEASYCLAGILYRTTLEAKGNDTTPDGLPGQVYREDFPNRPFDFLFTRDTIGSVPYHRVYARPADGSNARFSWFADVTACTPANPGSSGGRSLEAPAAHPEANRRPSSDQSRVSGGKAN